MQYNVDNNLNASTIIFGEGSLGIPLIKWF